MASETVEQLEHTDTTAGTFAVRLVKHLTRYKGMVLAIAVLGVLLIGAVDYLTGGLRIAFAVVYALPVAFGTWFVNVRFGVFLVFLSVLAWLAGDTLAEVEWASPIIPLWNAFVRIAYYLSIVVLISKIQDMQENLEQRISDRAAALTRALEDRRRLEAELLEISDREQRRLGSDLHDTLSQHLAGTALACAVLVKRLDAKNLEEAEQARKIVHLVEQGTVLSRNVARGLNPVELFDEGLMFALKDLASTTSSMFGVNCRFVCEYPVLLEAHSATVQLFRIAQEAVTNATKHGKSSEVIIELSADEESVILNVYDDGIGITPASAAGGGIGLRIMGHRASLIGATLQIGPGREKGTLVTCVLPLDVGIEERDHG